MFPRDSGPSAPTPPPAPAANPGSNSQLDRIRDLVNQFKGNGGGSDPNAIWYAQAGNDLVFKSSNKRGPLLKVADLMWEFYQYSDAKVRSLAQQLYQAGWLQDPNVSRDNVWSAYRQILMEGAARYQADPTKAPTVEQILNGYMKSPIGDGAGGAGKKPSVYTQTQEQLNFTDPKQAAAMLSQTLQDRLGRAPSAAEKQAFMAALHTAEEQNPTVATTTYRLNPQSDTYDSSTKTTGGINPTGFLDDYSQGHNQKEHGAYQAATTYMNALMQAIGAPVG